jgi:hypothetical protein
MPLCLLELLSCSICTSPVFYTTTVVATGLSITQPDKIHLQETSDPNWANALALLKGLREAFAVHESAFTKLLKQATSENKLSKVGHASTTPCWLRAVRSVGGAHSPD